MRVLGNFRKLTIVDRYMALPYECLLTKTPLAYVRILTKLPRALERKLW